MIGLLMRFYEQTQGSVSVNVERVNIFGLDYSGRCTTSKFKH